MFLLATSGPPDPFITTVRRYAANVIAAANATKGASPSPFVKSADLVVDAATVASSIRTLSDDAKAAFVPLKGTAPDPDLVKKMNAAFDTNLGGLRGDTLVFLTHGLEPANPPTSTLGFTDPRQIREHGLLFHNAVTGPSNFDTIMQVQHLMFMKLQTSGTDPNLVTNVVTDTDKLTNQRIGGFDDFTTNDVALLQQDVPKFAPVIDALRNSIFERVYLGACGPHGRLGRFASLLHDLIGKDVYFNNDKIFVTTGGQPFLFIGPTQTGSGPDVTSQGNQFFTTTSVELKSTPKGFLPGAENLLSSNPPVSPTPPSVP